MCGICGVWRFDGVRVDAEMITAMNERLAHRGPDGAGLYLEDDLGLGHRRLAILDLSPAGHQPMSYGNGRWWITYNGEIYNFLELQQELEVLGHRFRSRSDTEVILAAYAQWGRDCLLRFNGMWAFAIWDAQDRTLFLARDRFGVKPLFYWHRPHVFAFASEMKAFLDLPGFAPRPNLSVLKAELLDIHSQEGGPNCLLQDVYRLPAGHWLQVGADNRPIVQRWWRTLDHLITAPRRLEEQAEQFAALFTDACRIRMRSDVPIGTSLSGGLDSSAVVCTVAKLAQQSGTRQAADWQRAFVGAFPGTLVDERSYAELVIRQTNVHPTFVEMTAAQILDLWPITSYHVEQVVNGPLGNLWLIYQAQRRSGVVVTLDGHGGDELLAGYPHYTVAALYDAGSWPTQPRRYRELLHIYRGLLTSPTDTGPRVELGQLLWETHAWLRNVRRLAQRLGVMTKTANNAVSLADWFGPALAAVEPAPPTPTDELPGASLFRRTLYRDFHATVLPVILRNYDRMAMAHGVEVRMPFLDWRLVAFVFSLPDNSLLGEGYTKLILRRALRHDVPPAILARRDKVGFSLPLSRWMAGNGREKLVESLEDVGLFTAPLWRGAAIREAVSHLDVSSWRQISLINTCLAAQLWLRRFVGENGL
jgi:asparagine synthase (glutamine-hydrolysing)